MPYPHPIAGGRWIRDPITGALARETPPEISLPEQPALPPDADPPAEADPTLAPPERPARKKRI